MYRVCRIIISKSHCGSLKEKCVLAEENGWNIKPSRTEIPFKVDIYHIAGFFAATKFLIKYSLDITLAQSNLLHLNPGMAMVV